ncbi:ribosome assembly RNA-binding protein YhbY [Aerococcaceae bacterium DSM 111021]|nr:ribosome assembly RNA-binding protein YhbY [Aerococcaceae bacterium DSM 111021]
MITLNKAQIKFLRKYSHNLKPLFQMGKNGLTDVFIEQVDNAIEKRELIKFVILQNSDEDLDDVANKIADEIDGVIIQTIGSTAILYRPSSKEKYQEISQQVQRLN